MNPIVSFLLIVGAIIFFIYRWWSNTPEYKGKAGEKVVNKELAKLPESYKVLEDVVLQTERGTTQIDHIVISKHGVFAIETKNYRGDIYGDDNRKEWTQIIVTKVRYAKKWYKTYTYVTKNYLYNPVKQSYLHMYEIKRNLKEWPHLKVIPIVVFTGFASLKNVQTKNHVIYETELLDVIRSYQSIYLTDEEVEEVVERLTQKNVRELVSNSAHVKNIKAAKRDLLEKLEADICPRCGGHLILRNGKYGQFYGCSNYPKCRYTVQ